MTKSVKFYTLGCKTNQYETQAMRELLTSAGFTEDHDEKADLYVVNTCTVTAKSDRESRSIIRHCHSENPAARIFVTGCLVQNQNDEGMVKGLPGVSGIIRNEDKGRIADFINRDSAYFYKEKIGAVPYTPLKISDFHDRTKAFVKIQDGCDNFCSYCKVPLARGRSRSRAADDILYEIRRLLDSGFKEIVLTGISIGDWGKTLNGHPALSQLIKDITGIENEFRLRLSSIEPLFITDELIKNIAESKKACRHLHIPLQSGSDRILKLMNRPYTARYYLELIRRLKDAMPDISITSDAMVGFPGETAKDFRETVRMVHSVTPSRLHVFTYSKRPGTAASKIVCNHDTREIKSRRDALLKIADALSLKYRRRFLNRVVEGLIETRRDPRTHLLTGYTDTYIKCLVEGQESLMGRLIPLKVYKLDIKSTFCKYLL